MISYDGQEVGEISISNFDIDEISILKYFDGYYYFYGKNCSTIVDGAVTYDDYGMLSTIDNESFNTVSPINTLFAAPINLTNNIQNDNHYNIFLAKKDIDNLDIVTVNTDNHKIHYLYVNVPECYYVHSAKSNECGDVAILKYSDENFSSYSLVLVDNNTILSAIS